MATMQVWLDLEDAKDTEELLAIATRAHEAVKEAQKHLIVLWGDNELGDRSVQMAGQPPEIAKAAKAFASSGFTPMVESGGPHEDLWLTRLLPKGIHITFF